jgi:hypothetical protein
VNEVNSISEKLHSALEECLEEELKEIPEESEIKKQYTFSTQFHANMKKLLQKEKNKEKYKVIYQNRRFFYQLATATALIIIIIYARNMIITPDTNQDSSSNQESMKVEMATTESATVPEGEAADSMTKSMLDESSQDTNTSNISWTLQEVVDAKAKLRIENTTEEIANYGDIFKVEQYKDGAWVEIYAKEAEVTKELNPQESVEEEIVLADYTITESGSYRLYRTVNNETQTVDLEYIK